MKLIHTCPECKKDHEMECTPEPSQLCPECAIDRTNISDLHICFDCGNTPLQKDEAMWLENKIKELADEVGIKITKLNWWYLD